MKSQEVIAMSNKIYGIEVLNKSIIEKEIYYTKLLNKLHDVTIRLGYTPDPQFYGALLFTKAKEEKDIQEVTNLSEFEENRVKQYSEYLCDIINKDMDKVDPTDILSLIVFQRENPGSAEWFDSIIYKSKCKDCEVEDVPKPTAKVYKNRLGQFTKED
jgi:hypothetical protein